MNQEMLQKLDELFESGKITIEQKDLLIKALAEKDSQETQLLEIPKKLDTEKKELQIKLLDEDIELRGDNQTTQVAILKGSELVEVIKSENKILIQSIKENRSFLGNVIRNHDIIKDKHGFRIHPRQINDGIVVTVPVFMISQIKTVSGDILIQNLTSEIEIKSVSGDIEIENLQGTSTISSISGDININQTKGITEITSKSGDISVKHSDLKGAVKTYSGDINIDKSTLENLEISVFSGDISLKNSKANQQILCKSFSGDIDISFTNQTGYVKGTSISGDIELFTADNQVINLNSREHGSSEDPLQILIKTTSGDGKIRFTNE